MLSSLDNDAADADDIRATLPELTDAFENINLIILGDMCLPNSGATSNSKGRANTSNSVVVMVIDA